MLSFLSMLLVFMSHAKSPTEVILFPAQADIRLELWRREPLPCDVYWLAVHENEHVANAYVAKRVLKAGGLLAVIRQRGERHIYFKYEKQEYQVDPNRVFTPIGAKASLVSLNPELESNQKALAALTGLALKLGEFMLEPMKRFKNTPAIIALHNNTPGFDDDGKGGEGTISIQRYLKKLEAGASFIADVCVNLDHDEDDLFFVTDPEHFAQMKKDHWNALLQHKQVATLEDEDDGSLSVYSEMKQWQYINIEAQRDPDHEKVQCKMVDYVWSLLDCP